MQIFIKKRKLNTNIEVSRVISTILNKFHLRTSHLVSNDSFFSRKFVYQTSEYEARVSQMFVVILIEIISNG